MGDRPRAAAQRRRRLQANRNADPDSRGVDSRPRRWPANAASCAARFASLTRSAVAETAFWFWLATCWLASRCRPSSVLSVVRPTNMTNRPRHLRLATATPQSINNVAESANLVVDITSMHKRNYSLTQAWEDAIGGWCLWLKLGGISAQTMRLRQGHVRSIARRSNALHPGQLTADDVFGLCSERTWSNDHQKGVRTSLISFFNWCVQNQHVSHNPAAELPNVIPSRPRPRPATDEIWFELIASATPRERLMARLAGEAGMRREEVSVCSRNDLIRDQCGFALIVHGKGGKQRVVPIMDSLADAIREFCPGGYLFPGSIDGHISAGHVGRLISRLMPEGWSMHKLRHRYATRGYAGTGNLRAVQEALGHASVATTQIYTAVASHEVRAVAEAAGYGPDVA
jgi:integrase